MTLFNGVLTALAFVWLGALIATVVWIGKSAVNRESRLDDLQKDVSRLSIKVRNVANRNGVDVDTKPLNTHARIN